MPVSAPSEHLPVNGDAVPLRAPGTKEDFFREAFAHAAVGVAVTDLTGRFLQVNSAYCAITGYDEAELVATDFVAITHPDDRAGSLQLARMLLAGDISHFDVEKRYLKKSGEIVWALNSISLGRDGQGQPTHCIALCQDITARKRAAEERDRLLLREREARAAAESAVRVLEEARAALRASEEQYRSLADLIPGVAWTARPDGWVDYANQFWFDFTGLTLEQTQGSGWAALLHPDDVKRVDEIWATALQAGQPVEVEYRLKRAADGLYRWFLARGKPVRDREGRVVKWFGMLTDIDDQKQASKALERQNALVRLLHGVTFAAYSAATVEEALQVGIDLVCAYTGWPVGHVYVVADDGSRVLIPTTIWHLDHREEFASFLRVTETTRLALGEGLPGRVLARREPTWIMDVTRNDNFPRARAATNLGVRGAFGFPVLTAAGVVAVLEFFTNEPQEPDSLLLQAMVQVGIQLGHIFERKHAEEALRRREASLRQQNAVITELAKDLKFFNDDLDTVFHRSTEAAAKTLQVKRASIWLFNAEKTAIVCRDLYEAGTHCHSQGATLEASAFPGYFQALALGDPIPADDARSDPRTRELSSSYLERVGITSMLDTVIRQQGRDVGVMCCEHIGPARRWSVEEQSFAASLTSLIALALETHERRLAEERLAARSRDLELARDEANRADRAKSDFLSRMSHELRTPLNAILGFAQLLEMGDPTPKQRHHVEQILKGGKILLGVINEVLDLARIEAGLVALSPEPIRVSYLFGEVMDLLRPLAAQRGTRLSAAAGETYVLADSQRLKQVLLNLVSNAVKYSYEQDSVTLSVEEVSPGRARLLVHDNGPGLAPEQQERLFNPFDRLGAEATEVEGTGLGLVVCKRLVEAMGGALGVISAAGRGSTFFVVLPTVAGPRSRSAEGRGPVAPGPATVTPRRKTVLYVEDNPDNLALVEGILAYRPQVRLLSARQGGQSLELARHYRPDLILLDVHLPDMNGDEVLRRLRADPSLRATPVIAVSADATSHQEERLRAAGAWDYLTKPLDVTRFLALLDRVLKEGVGP